MSAGQGGARAVIVTVDADAAIMPELEAHARYGLEQFRDFKGFVSGALHMNDDGTRLVQYLRWQTEGRLPLVYQRSTMGVGAVSSEVHAPRGVG